MLNFQIVERLLTMQYRDWHTLDIDTLRYDVKIKAITPESFERITGEKYERDQA